MNDPFARPETGRNGSTDPKRRARLQEEIFGPLRHAVPDVETPPAHRLSRIVSAIALGAVVAVYAGLMGAAVWFSLDYLVSHGRLLAQGVAPASVGLYLALGAVVLAVVALVVKPALRIPPKPFEPLVVTRREQPVLYAYVEALCRALRAPPPERIALTAGAGASARPIKPFRFGPPRLELSIGLALMVAFDLRQLTAVLAHELGHFARHRNMRVHSFAGAINLWFLRAIYEPDRFDLWLQKKAGGPPIVRTPFVLAYLITRLGRRILWLFMVLGQVACGLMSRQDEYFADVYSVRLAGRTTTAEALRRIAVLSVAEDAAYSDVEDTLQEKRLPDDLPQVIAAKAERLTSDERDKLLAAISAQGPGWFDTHPTLPHRLGAIERYDTEGVIASTRPARQLVKTFDAVCRTATQQLYKHVLDDDARRAAVVPWDLVVREHAEMEQSREALARFFDGDMPTVRPILPDGDALRAPTGAEAARRDLVEARNRALDSRDDLRATLEEYLAVREIRSQLYKVQALHEAGVPFGPMPDLGLSRVDTMSLDTRQNETRGDEARLANRLHPMETAVRRRMNAAIRLLSVSPEVETDVSEDSLRRMVAAAGGLRQAKPMAEALSRQVDLTLMLAQIVQQHGAPRAIVRRLDSEAEGLRTSLAELKDSLRPVDYPFRHAEGEISLGSFLVEKVPTASDHEGLVMAGMECLEKLDTFTTRLMARFAHIATEAERALGFEPSPLTERTPHEEIAIQSEPADVSYATKAGLAQVGLAVAVAMLVVGLGAAFIAAQPRYSLLPKHDAYRPTLITPEMTPPPRANVWTMGARPYRHESIEVPPPAGTPGTGHDLPSARSNADPWGRPKDWRTNPSMPWNRSDRSDPTPGHDPFNPRTSHNPRLRGMPEQPNPSTPYGPNTPNPYGTQKRHTYGPNTPNPYGNRRPNRHMPNTPGRHNPGGHTPGRTHPGIPNPGRHTPSVPSPSVPTPGGYTPPGPSTHGGR